MHAFHSHPVIKHQFPRGLAALSPAQGLPVPDLLGALLLERAELPDSPMGSVFDGGFHGPQCSGCGGRPQGGIFSEAQPAWAWVTTGNSASPGMRVKLR